MQPIIESGMRFGIYQEGYCFHIEKSDLYQKIQEDVKIAEFLLYRDTDKHSQPAVWIIEAKSSSPQPRNQSEFDNFIQEIKEKFFNTLFLYVSIKLQRHTITNELPTMFEGLDIKETNFRFILVIKGHQEGWLPPLQDELRKTLKPILKIWNLPPTSVFVLNDGGAQKYGLIQANEL